MNNKLSKLLLAVTTIAGVAVFALVLNVQAARPADYGLVEGWTISAPASNDPDVYIVNEPGYKRLFLNPVIFNFYGHLGGFANVHSVSATTRDAFPTSGLFRNCEPGSVNNNGRVYGVSVSGEDTGMLHWVNMSGSQAVAEDAAFFNKVFCINDNEFNWYTSNGTNFGADYTALSQIPVYSRQPGVTPTPVPGNVNISLASDNPGANSLTTKANGVTFLKLNISGTGTLSSLRVVRRGPGVVADIANVYLYDGATRLTSGRSPSSSDGSVTFSSLNLAISGSKTLSVVADLLATGATAGDVHYFSIDSSSDVVLSAGTVGGSFPINGNNMTITGAVGGTITVDKSSSLSNPNVGQANVELSEFKLTSATEGDRVSRLTMIQGGTMSISGFTNLSLKVNGVQVATGYTTSNGYIVFDFGSNPYVIAKGDNRIFQVFGNVAGKKAETVILYFEQTADVFAIGDQFGFGVSVTNNMGTTATAHTLTLQGGIVTLSFIGPTANNVSTVTVKTHLLDFDINSAADIEVRKTALVLCLDIAGDGTYDDANAVAASLSNGFGDLMNVSVINRDTGVTIVGPADGSTFTTDSAAQTGGSANDCGTAASGWSKLFTDAYNLTAGGTQHLAIVADVKASNATTNNLATGSIFKALLFGYGNLVSTGDVTIMKYSGTNTAVASTDIVPSANISGNNMTVQTAGLTLAAAASPAAGNHNYVKGSTGVNVNGFSFTAALGNPVTINSITFQGYAGATTTVATTNNPGAMIAAIRLVDGTTGAVIASGPSSNNLSLTSGVGSGQVQFTNLNWLIPAGATKTVVVQVDLTNIVPATNIVLSFDIAATTDVVGVDANSNTINAANAAVNGTTTAITYVTMTSVGTLTSALAGTTPISGPVYWGQNGANFSKFRFTSTNEGFFIERLNLNSADTTADLINNLGNLTISYTKKGGATGTASAGLNSAGSVSFAFSGTDRPYVPKDGTMDVTVSANIKTAAELFRAGGAIFSIDLSGGNADEFSAFGEGSGTAVTGTGSGIANRVGNNMYIYRSFPSFSNPTTPATNLAAGQDIARFTVTANGLSSDGATVLFDGATAEASGSINFGITASGESTSSLTLELRRADNNQLLATASAITNSAGLIASASFRIGSGAGTTTLEIAPGTPVDLLVRISAVSGFVKPSATGRAADYVIAILKNIELKVKWVDNSGTHRVGSEANVANILQVLPLNFGTVRFQ